MYGYAPGGLVETTKVVNNTIYVENDHSYEIEMLQDDFKKQQNEIKQLSNENEEIKKIQIDTQNRMVQIRNSIELMSNDIMDTINTMNSELTSGLKSITDFQKYSQDVDIMYRDELSNSALLNFFAIMNEYEEVPDNFTGRGKYKIGDYYINGELKDGIINGYGTRTFINNSTQTIEHEIGFFNDNLIIKGQYLVEDSGIGNKKVIYFERDSDGVIRGELYTKKYYISDYAESEYFSMGKKTTQDGELEFYYRDIEGNYFTRYIAPEGDKEKSFIEYKSKNLIYSSRGSHYDNLFLINSNFNNTGNSIHFLASTSEFLVFRQGVNDGSSILTNSCNLIQVPISCCLNFDEFYKVIEANSLGEFLKGEPMSFSEYQTFLSLEEELVTIYNNLKIQSLAIIMFTIRNKYSVENSDLYNIYKDDDFGLEPMDSYYILGMVYEENTLCNLEMRDIQVHLENLSFVVFDKFFCEIGQIFKEFYDLTKTKKPSGIFYKNELDFHFWNNYVSTNNLFIELDELNNLGKLDDLYQVNPLEFTEDVINGFNELSLEQLQTKFINNTIDKYYNIGSLQQNLKNIDFIITLKENHDLFYLFRNFFSRSSKKGYEIAALFKLSDESITPICVNSKEKKIMWCDFSHKYLFSYGDEIYLENECGVIYEIYSSKANNVKKIGDTFDVLIYHNLKNEELVVKDTSVNKVLKINKKGNKYYTSRVFNKYLIKLRR